MSSTLTRTSEPRTSSGEMVTRYVELNDILCGKLTMLTKSIDSLVSIMTFSGYVNDNTAYQNY